MFSAPPLSVTVAGLSTIRSVKLRLTIGKSTICLFSTTFPTLLVSVSISVPEAVTSTTVSTAPGSNVASKRRLWFTSSVSTGETAVLKPW